MSDSAWALLAIGLLVLLGLLVTTWVFGYIGLGRWLVRKAGLDDPPKGWWKWWWGWSLTTAVLASLGWLYDEMETAGLEPGGFVLATSVICGLTLWSIFLVFAIREMRYQIGKRRGRKQQPEEGSRE